MAAFTGAKQLRRVGLKGTKITDDGLRQIENLPRLEDLYVPQTVSDAGIQRLREKRTRLRVIR